MYDFPLFNMMSHTMLISSHFFADEAVQRAPKLSGGLTGCGRKGLMWMRCGSLDIDSMIL